MTEIWTHAGAQDRSDCRSGGRGAGQILTSTRGQTGLPRYFAPLFERVSTLAEGRLDFVLPDGRRFQAGGRAEGGVAEIRVVNRGVFARVLREGEVGFGESYMDGWWTTPDLQALMDLVQRPANAQVTGRLSAQGLVRAYERIRFWLQGNSRAQARRNIAAHYDLGNDFYAMWLDPSMTYSSALYEGRQDNLDVAQTRKYAEMVDRIGAVRGDHVLEIGCGWGGFAEYAAGQRGLKVTALTISQAQHDYAVARISRAGLSDMVTIKLQDYRDETGVYDGIASVEMFEAVGEKYWPTYFAALHARLKPGRAAVLQVITLAEDRWHRYRNNVDFIQKFIFPGGMLPTPSRLRQEGARAGLAVAAEITFGESYSRTLRQWRENFTARWDDIRALGFDDRFRRMWDFYLTSCAGAFHGGNCDVTQITLRRPEP